MLQRVRRAATIMSSHRRALHADLRRFYHLDPRALARGDVSLPEWVDLVEQLLHMPESAVARSVNGGPVWTTTDFLLADAFHALTGKPHPGRPKASSADRERDPKFYAARERARARARERQRRIDAGEIT